MDYAIYWVCCISANEGGEGAEIVWFFYRMCKEIIYRLISLLFWPLF
jgi:hypothetical protein